jgi:cytochrome c oxidase assembly factor CtaG
VTGWNWEPSVVIGCTALVAVYFAIAGKFTRRAIPFLAGVTLLLLALVSPLDALGDEYLLSAHVAQHFLLALIVPPLLVLGAPASLSRLPGLRPWLAWPLGVATMLVWHIPALFNAALGSELLHIAQHLSFLVAGVIFWWPIFGPDRSQRLHTAPAIGYLFSACVACSLLGAALTFGPVGAYPAYLNPADSLHILPLIRDVWGLDAKSDQQLAGMLMWVPGCFVYLGAILSKIGGYYHVEAAA